MIANIHFNKVCVSVLLFRKKLVSLQLIKAKYRERKV